MLIFPTLPSTIATAVRFNLSVYAAAFCWGAKVRGLVLVNQSPFFLRHDAHLYV